MINKIKYDGTIVEDTLIMDMPDAAYHADNGYLSSSQLKTVFSQSVAHMIADKEKKQEDNKVFSFGRGFHCMMLEPHKFEEDFMEQPEILPSKEMQERIDNGEITKFTGTKEYREKKAALEAEIKESSKTIIHPAEYAQMIHMRNNMNTSPLTRKYLESGLSEVSIFTTIDGVKYKARFDKLLMTETMIDGVDIKTTQCASHMEFGYSIRRYKYDMSAFHYFRVLHEALINNNVRTDGIQWKWTWPVCEKERPYGFAFYTASKERMEQGRDKWFKAHQRILDANNGKSKVGYEASIVEVEI